MKEQLPAWAVVAIVITGILSILVMEITAIIVLGINGHLLMATITIIAGIVGGACGFKIAEGRNGSNQNDQGPSGRV